LQNFDDLDIDSITLEDILEDSNYNKIEDKVEFLQQKVNDLFDSLQQKSNEVALLQKHIQELTKKQQASQQAFRQIFLNLQSENLTQTMKDTVVEIYRLLT
jgi:predicted nuclease with TOPRIM domain